MDAAVNLVRENFRFPVDLLREAIEKHHPAITLACSFQAEDIVVLDMMHRLQPYTKVFALDTGRLHDETYDVAEQIRCRYGDIVEWYFPDKDAVQKLLGAKGLFSFRDSVENRVECCFIRKVEPLKRALKGMTAWVTGLRKEQSATRTQVAQIEVDKGNGGILKYNPLIEWTTQEVWAYVREHRLPYNKLYERGFTQIGCSPCTTPVFPGEDLRAGRWRWEQPEHKECGLHKDGSGI
ncbi:MAG: phosphoadenylyl-sulfate reductase [Myxococcales bacterium]|nr:MAG: phosphoadenylyl-sulfate reductase [Myxococcales bacterium]